MSFFKKNVRLLAFIIAGLSILFISDKQLGRSKASQLASQASLAAISTFASAQEEFETANKHTLFVFDVDETLVTTSDPVFQLENLIIDTRNFLSKSSLAPKKLIKQFPQHDALLALADIFPNDRRLATLLRLYPDERSGEELLSIVKELDTFLEKILPASTMLKTNIERNQPLVLLDQDIPMIIKNLKKRHIPVIALSAFAASMDTTVISNQERRYRELENLGIIFSTEKEIPSFHLDCFNSEANPFIKPDYTPSSKILFYKGIISSATIDKGLVLKHFIQCMDKNPHKVVFFNNVFANLISVAEILKQLGIAGHTYLVTAEQELPKEKVDLAIMRKQLEYMQQTNNYVSYEQARKIYLTWPAESQAIPSLPGAVETEE